MSLQTLTKELYQLFNKEDYEQCLKVLQPIKIEIIKHNLFVPVESNTNTADKLNDLRITEKILGIGALSSLLSNDYQGFENYFAQLRPFYANEKIQKKREENSDCTKIIALYLLYLLSQGLISKFHVELESLFYSGRFPIDNFLQFPIYLERNLMEGNYNKLWRLLNENKENLPYKEFMHFRETLTIALRFEIARSMEKAYTSFPISNCKSLLFFPQEMSDAELQRFATEYLEAENWRFENGEIIFEKSSDEPNDTTSNLDIVHDVLYYADKVESIV